MRAEGDICALQLAAPRADEPALELGSHDVLVSLLSFAVSLSALFFAMSPFATSEAFIALYAASLFVPLTFVSGRRRRKAELTMPLLLLVTSFACGPLGGLGCALTGLALRRRR